MTTTIPWNSIRLSSLSWNFFFLVFYLSPLLSPFKVENVAKWKWYILIFLAPRNCGIMLFRSDNNDTLEYYKFFISFLIFFCILSFTSAFPNKSWLKMLLSRSDIFCFSCRQELWINVVQEWQQRYPGILEVFLSWSIFILVFHLYFPSTIFRWI